MQLALVELASVSLGELTDFGGPFQRNRAKKEVSQSEPATKALRSFQVGYQNTAKRLDA